MSDYKKQFPESPLLSDRMKAARGKASTARASHLSYSGAAPDTRLMEFLTGTMLGDGSLERMRGTARYADASSNEPYAVWKHGLLSRYFRTSINKRVSRAHRKTGKRYTAWFVRTCTHPLLSEWHSEWYPDRKCIARDLVDRHLTSFALAVWFFDDGNITSRIHLYTLAFSREDVEWLRGLVETRFGLQTLVRQGHGDSYMVVIPASHRQDFLRIVSPHCAPGMDYKVQGR